MKIAISSTGENLESEVDARFGRCPYFIIVEIEEKEIKNVKAVENEAVKQAGGAGMTAAQTVADQKVEAIITSNMGPRAFGVFQQLKIDVYLGKGTVKDAVQDFIDGKLEKVGAPTGPMFVGQPGGGRGLGDGRGQGKGQNQG